MVLLIIGILIFLLVICYKILKNIFHVGGRIIRVIFKILGIILIILFIFFMIFILIF
jgi:hypothetical protein